MGRKPDDVKVTTSGGLSVMGEITLSSGGKTVKLGGNPTEQGVNFTREEAQKLRALAEYLMRGYVGPHAGTVEMIRRKVPR